MKMIFAIFILSVVFANAKKEFKVKDCGGENSIVTFNEATDITNPTIGPITRKLKVKVTLTSSKDTKSLDPFDIDMTLSLKKYLLWGYIPAPGFVYNKIGASLQGKSLTYMGNGVYRAHCLFKFLYGSCLPPKGVHTSEVNMQSVMEKVLNPFGILVPSLGWYKVKIVAKTRDGQSAFCIDSEVQLANK